MAGFLTGRGTCQMCTTPSLACAGSASLVTWAYRDVDPVFALPPDVVGRLGLRAQVMCKDPDGSMDERLGMHSVL